MKIFKKLKYVITLSLMFIVFAFDDNIINFDFVDIGEYEIIEGYTDKNSYEIGDTVHFFFKK